VHGSEFATWCQLPLRARLSGGASGVVEATLSPATDVCGNRKIGSRNLDRPDNLANPRAVRRTFLFFLLIAGASLLWGLVWQTRSGRPPKERVVEGQIVDAQRGTPVSGAQIISDDGTGSPIGRTFSDPLGRFSFTKSAVSSGPSSFIVRAPGYAELRLNEDSPSIPRDRENIRSTTLRVELKQSSSEEHDRPDIVRDFRSGPVPSGQGADFRVYSLCSDPPDSVPKDYVVKSAQFNLAGDRRCNAWATCSEQSRTSKQICWQFSMQGHNECNLPFGHCSQAALSEGFLHVTYGFVAPESSPSKAQVVYIQFASTSQEKDAAQLCEAVIRQGYVCPPPVKLRGQFSPGLKWFDPHDEASAGELSVIATHTGVSSVLDTPKQENLSTRPVGAMEIWLNGPEK